MNTDNTPPLDNQFSTHTSSSTVLCSEPEKRKKKPYKELTLEEKVQLIRLAEDNSGLSQASIAERYTIAKSNVCRILQRKHEYIRAYESAGFAGSRKRKLRSPHSENNKSVKPFDLTFTQPLDQFKEINSDCVDINNPLLFEHNPGILKPIPTNPFPTSFTISKADPLSFNNNETLRAHMYKQHQISRMFMCKCCNWAFPDKTSLHMHVQAKEEGKAISVPVIGKGNPPSTSTLQNATSHLLGLSNHQTNVNINSTLPSSSSFNSLHGLSNLSASLPLQQAFGLGDQNLFPQLQMMQNSNNNDLINKVKDNIFLTSLMPNLGLQNWFAAAMSAASSQSGFNLSNVENTMNQPIDMEKVFATLHSLEEQNGQDNLSTLETMASNKKNSERDQNGMADTSSSNSSTNSSPAPITMEKNSAKTFFKHEEMGNDIPLNISADDNSHTQQSAQCSGVSPSETNSSISPSTDNGSSTGCYDCGMQKSKFAVVENRCRYLEERMSTLQAETLRYSTRLTVAESSCRQVESDLRSQREQNELLQKKLLECQEKSLAFMQSVDYQSSSSINALLNELIKSTIFQ